MLRKPIVLALALVCVACSRTGELSGDLFVTMKSGDVKRGADVQISLVAATEEFDGAWKKAVAEFATEYGTADADYQQAQRAQEEAHRRRLEDIRRGWYTTSAPDYGTAMAAAVRVDEVRRRYRILAERMIADARPKLARTDVNGHYEFKDVPTGRYYVFAEHRVFDNDLRWKLAVEMKSGPNRIDLSNSNAGWPF